jgi:chromosome segregation ATPase
MRLSDDEFKKLVLDMLAAHGRQLTDINGQLGALRGDVEVLKRDVSTLKQDVSTLKQDVSTLKQDVSTLKQDVAVLKDDVAVLKTDVAALKTHVEQLEVRVTGLEAGSFQHYTSTTRELSALRDECRYQFSAIELRLASNELVAAEITSTLRGLATVVVSSTRLIMNRLDNHERRIIALEARP